MAGTELVYQLLNYCTPTPAEQIFETDAEKEALTAEVVGVQRSYEQSLVFLCRLLGVLVGSYFLASRAVLQTTKICIVLSMGIIKDPTEQGKQSLERPNKTVSILRSTRCDYPPAI